MFDQSVRRICGTLAECLKECIDFDTFSLAVFGSATLDDFRPGISDIDILVLTDDTLTPKQADELLMLRQCLTEREQDPLFRTLEGGILGRQDFLFSRSGLVVYWGTHGQRIDTSYCLSGFDRLVLYQHGIILYGKGFRDHLSLPTQEELLLEIARRYQVIRRYARETSGSIHAINWLFDIARGLYTLCEGDVVSKSAAARWALSNGICPDEVQPYLEAALRLRESTMPPASVDSGWLASLGGPIQRFADVLREALFHFGVIGMPCGQ